MDLHFRPMRLHSRIQETPDTFTQNFVPLDGKPFVNRPGQFTVVKVGETGVCRPYTVSSTHGISEFVTTTVCRVPGGCASNWITTVPVGSTVHLAEPMGDFTCDDDPMEKFLLMASGSGITPILSMTRWLLVHKPRVDIEVVYTTKSPAHIVQRDWWRVMTECRPELKTRIFTKENACAPYLTGRLTAERLAELVPDYAERRLYACASPGFMKHLDAWRQALGIDDEHFRTEAFGC